MTRRRDATRPQQRRPARRPNEVQSSSRPCISSKASSRICSDGRTARGSRVISQLYVYLFALVPPADMPHAVAVVSFNPEPAATVAPLAAPSPLAPG